MSLKQSIPAILSLLVCAGLAPAQFTSGQIVVLRIGGDAGYVPGGSSLTGNGTAGFIDQFLRTTANQTLPTLTVTLPTTTSGGVNRVNFSGTNVAGGMMTRSADGQSLAVPGYDVALGQSSVSTSSNNRVIAHLGFGATVATPVLSTSYSGTPFHGAVTNSGANFWAAGATTGTVTYQPSGSAQLGTIVQSNVPSSRAVNIFNGQLYLSTSTGTKGLYTVGTGTPTTATSASIFLETGATSLPAGFAISPNGSIVYVADERAGTSGGGIQRWNFDGSSWSLAYTLTTSITGATGARGLAVDFTGASPVLFATTTETSSNRLVTITDSGAGSSFVTLAQSPTNTVFRGVDLSPVPIPEPLTTLGLAAGGLGLAGVLRRRWKRSADTTSRIDGFPERVFSLQLTENNGPVAPSKNGR